MREYRHYRLKLIATKILRNWGLKWDHELTPEDYSIIEEIYFHKVYSLYFPFYRKSTIIDIGSHKGFFALFAAMCSPADSRIVCFEPSQSNFNSLSKNIELNSLHNIEIVNKGVSSKSGERKLYLSSSANYSLLNEYEELIGKNTAEFEKVNVTTIAEIVSLYDLQEIDFLKIDCEGSEYDILFNLDDMLYKKIHVISVEFHDLKEKTKCGNALVVFLKSKGFEIPEFTYINSISNVNAGHITAIKQCVFKK